MQIYLNPRIVADSAILSGKPVIVGTQVPVSRIVEQIAAGQSLAEVARANNVSVDDVRAALEYAATRADEPVAPAYPDDRSGHAGVGQKVPTVEEEARNLGLDPATLSPLGRRLVESHVAAIASGERMLSSWDELDAEIAERRGERYPDADQ